MATRIARFHLPFDQWPIVLDTNEVGHGSPWDFGPHPVIHRQVKPTGDVALLGYEGRAIIEYKGPEDMVNCTVPARDHFRSQCARMAALRFLADTANDSDRSKRGRVLAVVVGMSMDEIMAPATAFHSDTERLAVVRTAVEFCQRAGIGLYWCDGRKRAAEMMLRLFQTLVRESPLALRDTPDELLALQTACAPTGAGGATR